MNFRIFFNVLIAMYTIVTYNVQNCSIPNDAQRQYLDRWNKIAPS